MNSPHPAHVRWMIRRDMPEVLAIEAESFDHPWSEDDFLRCLRQRNCTGMFAEHDERVVGYTFYELHREKLHLLNIAAAAGHRRHGVAERMVDRLKSKLSPSRRVKLMCEVRETNLVALNFFKSQGFLAKGLFHDFYDDSDEDAIVIVHQIAESGSTAAFGPVRGARRSATTRAAQRSRFYTPYHDVICKESSDRHVTTAPLRSLSLARISIATNQPQGRASRGNSLNFSFPHNEPGHV